VYTTPLKAKFGISDEDAESSISNDDRCSNSMLPGDILSEVLWQLQAIGVEAVVFFVEKRENVPQSLFWIEAAIPAVLISRTDGHGLLKADLQADNVKVRIERAAAVDGGKKEGRAYTPFVFAAKYKQAHSRAFIGVDSDTGLSHGARLKLFAFRQNLTATPCLLLDRT
jgi:hypothetical protein